MVITEKGVRTPGHHAKDFCVHGAAEPDGSGKAALPEEKFVAFKSNHVAFGSHPHDVMAIEKVSVPEFLVWGEHETIDPNKSHSDEGISKAESPGCGPVRPDMGNRNSPSEVLNPAVIT